MRLQKKMRWILIGLTVLLLPLTLACVLFDYLPTSSYAFLDEAIPNGADVWIPGADELKTHLFLAAWNSSKKTNDANMSYVPTLDLLSNAVQGHFMLTRYGDEVEPQKKYIAIQRQIESILRQHGKRLSPNLLEHLEKRAIFACSQNWPEGDEFFRTAFEDMKTTYGRDNPKLLSLIKEGAQYYRQGEPEKNPAMAWMLDKLAFEINQREMGPNNEELPGMMRKLADEAERIGDTKMASDLRARIMNIESAAIKTPSK